MPSITVNPIDFSATPLAGPYSPFFALILDNVFTASECRDLIALAETAPWQPANAPRESSGAAASTGKEYAPIQSVSQNFRHSERILRDDPETAQMIFERIQRHLVDVAEIGPESRWMEVTGKAGQKWSAARGETGFWRLTKYRLPSYTTC
jgi:hypothetical protein